ncbi:unnamed protein product (macronuclear) [Paramecium tetraurelia]|uniref:TRP C-terminal domain-containing protein n=1 Tax=Paramecium tetraurelia TaxID=5888 RepID=A0BBC2_PARTE|nr:uncharacterized protein GSPATT00000274001 [Paramecium tetraurelia]CAK55839.1 unnamed protein product [Paramecium tetraurelia]|eukprot:XP_001423237.1 hypothetical protein (macronuclear) [Paramecium tetraurelia strain d4-2]
MDYNDQSVGVCYCCMFFTYKHYIYLMMTTNAIQGLVLIAIGIFGLLEQFELLVFQRPIALSLLKLGSLVVFGLILQFIFFIRHSVYYIGKIMVIVNVLTSLFDLSSGIILLLSCFIELTFIEFNETQQSFSSTKRTILLLISIIIIVISLYGFWMTYLQYQTIEPLQEQLEKETRVVPVISLRQAVAKKFSKNFIGDLTPNNGKMNRQTRGDSSSEQSQPFQRIQSKQQNQEELNEPSSNQRSEKLIKVPENMTPYNDYYTTSNNTIRLPQQTDDIQTLRKSRTPKSNYGKQQQQG